MTWDWDFVWEILPTLLEGAKVTVIVTIVAAAISTVLGLVWALGRRSASRIVSRSVGAFTEFVRRTPLLVQLYFIFFVMPSIGITLSATVAGVLAIGLHYSTYASEIYRAGIESIPKSQWEAAMVLDMPKLAVWGRVILPQAIPKVIPALGNTIIAMFKETALLAAIGVGDLMGVARRIGANTYVYTEPILVAGAIFFVVSYLSSLLLRRTERRLSESRWA